MQYGWICSNGKWLTDKFFDFCSPFSDGVALIGVNKHESSECAYVNRAGEPLFSGFFKSESTLFKEGLASVQTLDGRKCFIDRTGRMVFELDCDYVSEFSEGLAPFRKGERWGFINRDGSVRIPAKYVSAGRFSGGLALVSSRRNEWFFCNSDGEEVLGPFSFAGEFLEGLANVQLPNGKWAFLGRSGDVIHVEQDVTFLGRCDSGIAVAYVADSRVLVDRSGGIRFQPSQSTSIIETVGAGLAAIKEQRKFGFVDLDGNRIVPSEFDEHGIFQEGLCSVRQGASWLVIDVLGASVIESTTKIGHFREGVAVARAPDRLP